MKNYQSKMILISAFLLALISLLYELVIIQTISSFLGNSFKSYCYTIGIFTLSLGTGSIAYDYLIKKYSSLNIFLCIEILLSIFGGSSVITTYYFSTHNTDIFPLNIIIPLIPASICGLLSGLELPLLMDFIKNKHIEIKILSADYVGMFIGALAFPFVLLPNLSLPSIASLLGFINLLISFTFFLFIKDKNRIVSLGYFISFTIILLSNYIGNQLI